MPRIQIDNTEYNFYFVYYKAPDLASVRHIEVCACCILAGEVGTRDNQKKLIGNSYTYHNPKDTPNRRVARTVALDRAIKKAQLPENVATAMFNTIRSVPEALSV